MVILSIWLVLLRMTLRLLVEGVKGEVKKRTWHLFSMGAKHGCHVHTATLVHGCHVMGTAYHLMTLPCLM